MVIASPSVWPPSYWTPAVLLQGEESEDEHVDLTPCPECASGDGSRAYSYTGVIDEQMKKAGWDRWNNKGKGGKLEEDPTRVFTGTWDGYEPAMAIEMYIEPDDPKQARADRQQAWADASAEAEKEALQDKKKRGQRVCDASKRDECFVCGERKDKDTTKIVVTKSGAKYSVSVTVSKKVTFVCTVSL